jgi:hypothetical protein
VSATEPDERAATTDRSDATSIETEPVESEEDSAEARSVAAGFAGAGPSVVEAADNEPPRTAPTDAADSEPATSTRESTSTDPALAGLDTNGTRAAGPSLGAAATAVSAATTKPGPHPGSALPAPDGSAPSPEYAIKANSGSRRYYPPDSPYYVRTRGDLWFRAVADAEAAGFTPAP